MSRFCGLRLVSFDDMDYPILARAVEQEAETIVDGEVVHDIPAVTALLVAIVRLFGLDE